jgi:hypothetical protein
MGNGTAAIAGEPRLNLLASAWPYRGRYQPYLIGAAGLFY